VEDRAAGLYREAVRGLPVLVDDCPGPVFDGRVALGCSEHALGRLGEHDSLAHEPVESTVREGRCLCGAASRSTMVWK